MNLKRQISKAYRNMGIDIMIVFKSFKVRNYFSLKSVTPFALRAKVIYEFVCSCDESLSYIGKTKRHLTVRAKEHSSQKSAISHHLDHCKLCKDNFSLRNFNVLDHGNSDFELLIKEAFYIKKCKPKLNNQLFQNGASVLLEMF